MRTIPPFVAYPLFRLTVWLATGIFLFDSIASDCLPWTSVAMAFGVSVLILCCFYRTFKYKYRALFGVCGASSFVLLGGTLVLKEREAVYYPWDGRKQVYYGVVETVPSPKGKTLRAEVRVASVFNPADTLGGRVVNRSVLCSTGCPTVLPPHCAVAIVFVFMPVFRVPISKKHVLIMQNTSCVKVSVVLRWLLRETGAFA